MPGGRVFAQGRQHRIDSRTSVVYAAAALRCHRILRERSYDAHAGTDAKHVRAHDGVPLGASTHRYGERNFLSDRERDVLTGIGKGFNMSKWQMR